jgi:hypothetical protein
MDEQEIQQSFTDWLTGTGGYLEELSDPNGGAGALCDSVGMIGDRPVLIEFKRAVTPSIVAYSSKKSSSLERKVRNTLEDLHNEKFLKHWNKATIPFVWIVAERISQDASDRLNTVLSERTEEWYFEYEFGVWSGVSYSQLGKGPDTPISPEQLRNVTFPSMPWPGENRSPKRNFDEFQNIARQQGAREIFDYLIDRVHQQGFSIEYNRSSMNIKAPGTNTKKKRNVIGIWPGDSNQKGLCVSADRKRLTECFPDSKVETCSSPGANAPAGGYLGPRVYLASPVEAKAFWEWATGITEE